MIQYPVLNHRKWHDRFEIREGHMKHETGEKHTFEREQIIVLTCFLGEVGKMLAKSKKWLLLHRKLATETAVNAKSLRNMSPRNIDTFNTVRNTNCSISVL